MCDSVIQQQHRLKWNVKKTKPSHCHLQEKQGPWWAGRVFFFLSLTQMHNHVLRPCLAGRHLIELCHHADYFLLQMINCVQGVLGNSAHLFLCCSQQVTNGRGDNMTNLSGLQFNVNYMSIKICRSCYWMHNFSCYCSSDWSNWYPLLLHYKCIAQLKGWTWSDGKGREGFDT